MNQNSIHFFEKTTYSLPSFASFPIIIGWRISAPENIGSMLRLADTIGGKKVYIVENYPEYALRKIKKTAGESFNRVKLQFLKEDEWLLAIPPEYQLVAIETADHSHNIYRTSLPKKIAFLVGSEKHGIPAKILSEIDLTVHIPIVGECKSLNVTHALSIGMYEWIRQILQINKFENKGS